MDILYLDDYINLYTNNTIYKIKPYKNTLRNGLIINRYKFINKLRKSLNNNKLFLSNIYVIINNYHTDIDKEILKDILKYLNYNNIWFINELDYLTINKNKIYINCNYTYYYILYTNEYGNTNIELYNNKEIFPYIINKFINRDIFIYGKNSDEFINILNKLNIDYYVYEGKDNLIIKKILNCSS